MEEKINQMLSNDFKIIKCLHYEVLEDVVSCFLKVTHSQI